MALPRVRVWRGTDAERSSAGALPAGTLFWTTDTLRLFCGDGAVIGGHAVGPPTPLIPWNTTAVCYGLPVASNMSVTADSTNNKIVAVPVYIPATTNVKNAYFEVATFGSASCGVKLGLFESSSGVPGALVLNFNPASATAVTGTGVKSQAAAQNIRVPAGAYWIACVTNATYSVGSTGFQFNSFPSSTSSGLSYDSTTLDKINYKSSTSSTYGAWPPTMSGLTWTNETGNIPGLFVGAGTGDE